MAQITSPLFHVKHNAATASLVAANWRRERGLPLHSRRQLYESEQ
jgi:hypothetical protein